MLLSECRVAIFINTPKVGLLRTEEVSSSDRPCGVFTALPTAQRRVLATLHTWALGAALPRMLAVWGPLAGLQSRVKRPYSLHNRVAKDFLVLPQAKQYVPCPTCRQKAPVGDIAYVDAGRTAATETGSSSKEQHEEEKINVRGSYSTKVCLIYPLQPYSRLIWDSQEAISNAAFHIF